MRRPLRTTRALLAPAVALALLAGCADSPDTGTTVAATTTVVPVVEDATAITAGTDHDLDADYEWDASEEIAISLTGLSASSDSAAVVVEDGVVTITAAGTYRVSGSLDGQLVVDSADDGLVRIVLDGVELTSSTTSPLVIADAAKAMIVLADGSTNAVSDASEYVYPDAETDEPNGAIYSTADLTLTGSGALTVTGNAYDGIVGKDGLVISGGDITVTAVDDGIRGKDYLVLRDRVTSPSLTITSGGDGLTSTATEDAAAGYVSVEGGSATIVAGGDGIEAQTVLAVTGGTIAVDSDDDAVHSNGQVSITGGALTLTAADDGVHADGAVTIAGGQVFVEDSYEGLEGAQIVLSGGAIDVTATDDGINVAGGTDASGTGGPGGAGPGGGGGPGGQDTFVADVDYFLRITGGEIHVHAVGDGLDANGSIEITGGTTVVDGPADNGNGAIDADGGVLVTGGVLVASGSAGMAQGPAADSTQAAVAVTLDATRPGGTAILTEDGTLVASVTPTTAYGSLIVSTPDMTAGTSYRVAVGGTVVGAPVAGVVLDGEVTDPVTVATATT